MSEMGYIPKEAIPADLYGQCAHYDSIFCVCMPYGGAVSEGLFQEGLCLPSGRAMGEDEICRVVDAVRKTFKKV